MMPVFQVCCEGELQSHEDNSQHCWALSKCTTTLLNPKPVFPGSSVVKNPPAVQKMWVQTQGQEDPLEKEMVTHTHSSVLGLPLWLSW